jgi:hypothetical protein
MAVLLKTRSVAGRLPFPNARGDQHLARRFAQGGGSVFGCALPMPIEQPGVEIREGSPWREAIAQHQILLVAPGEKLLKTAFTAFSALRCQAHHSPLFIAENSPTL